MASLSGLSIVKTLEDRRIKFISSVEFTRLFKFNNPNTAIRSIQRLSKSGHLKRLMKDKYVFTGSQYNDFELANYLVNPSYVSFESALSFYGILPQFTYTITSATTKRSKKTFLIKEFEFTHIDDSLYWGFEKNKNYLIARPEKAILDQIYLSTKGLRGLDVDDLDLSALNKDLLKVYANKINNQRVTAFLFENKLLE